MVNQRGLFVVILVIFLGVSAEAQRIPVFGNLSFGTAIPVGSYGSSNGGYAKLGFNASLDGGVLLSKNFGVEALAIATYNSMRDPYWGSDAAYAGNALMVGPLFITPLTSNIYLQLRTVGGYARQQINISYATDAHGDGFCYNLGASLKYFISSTWLITLNADYFQSKIDYSCDYPTRKIQLVNITLGGGFLF